MTLKGDFARLLAGLLWTNTTQTQNKHRKTDTTIQFRWAYIHIHTYTATWTQARRPLPRGRRRGTRSGNSSPQEVPEIAAIAGLRWNSQSQSHNCAMSVHSGLHLSCLHAYWLLPSPTLQILAFFRFPCFFFFPAFPCFFCAFFLSFPRIFGAPRREKTLLFSRFSLRFSKIARFCPGLQFATPCSNGAMASWLASWRSCGMKRPF